jgi:hypothetical protein
MGYRGYLRKWIIPRWGKYSLNSIRAGEIELWLRSLPLARTSCAKIRNVMSVLFNHGLGYELLDRNPVQWVRQSAKRKKIPAVLEIEEVKSLLGALDLGHASCHVTLDTYTQAVTEQKRAAQNRIAGLARGAEPQAHPVHRAHRHPRS